MRSRKIAVTFILLILFFVAFLFTWGYQYGSGDLVQITTSVLSLHEHSLYAGDFFIQNSKYDFLNERSFVVYMLYPFFDKEGLSVFIFHFVFSILLFSGLLYVADIFLQNKFYSWLSLLILFFLLFYHSLGLSELNSTGLHPSEPMAIWGIYFWLKQKLTLSYVLFIIATLFQPIIGLQMFLLITGCEIIISVIEKRFLINTQKMLPGILIYILITGVFIYFLNNRFYDADITNEELFALFFEFRNAHHFLPHNFPLKDWLFLTPFYLLTPFIFYKINKKIFVFTLMIIVGCVIYTYFVEIHRSVIMAFSQWFKSTIWLEFFSVISVFLILQKVPPFILQKMYVQLITVVIVTCSLIWILYVFPGLDSIRNSNKYEFPAFEKITPEMDISLQAKQLTPVNALFIQPCSFSELKYFGQRSSYVDFKALTHKLSFLAEWSVRFQEVYRLQVNDSITGFNACNIADDNFRNLSPQLIHQLHEEKSITHILTYKECNLPFKLIAENKKYRIYQL